MIANLAQYNFTIYYISGKSNVEADALFCIPFPWDKVIESETVQAIIKAATECPEALTEVYAYSINVCEASKLDPQPEQMTQ